MRPKGFRKKMIDFRVEKALRIELCGQSIQQGSRVVSWRRRVAGEEVACYQGKRILIGRISGASILFWLCPAKVTQPDVNPAEWTAYGVARHPYKGIGSDVQMHHTACMQVKQSLSRLGDDVGDMRQFPGFPGFLQGQQICQGAVFHVAVDKVEALIM